MRYLVVIEKGPTSWGAHVPDLPGCVAVAETRDEVVTLIREAIENLATAAGFPFRRMRHDAGTDHVQIDIHPAAGGVLISNNDEK